jgi:hypothetical protein
VDRRSEARRAQNAIEHRWAPIFELNNPGFIISLFFKLTVLDLYKHFYLAGQGEIGGNEGGDKKKRSRNPAWQGLDGQEAAFL